METIVTRLADFATEIRFEDLPADVVQESKFILLDSIGCAFAGATSEKGKITLSIAREFGNSPEATIMGFGDKVSCVSAAFANGELINALDYEPILNPGHVQTGHIFPAPLAIGEKKWISGKELIVALVLALEISTRVGAALPYHREVVEGKVGIPPIYGVNCCIFGGTAAAGKVMGLDKETLSNALGIAGYIAPPQIIGKVLRSGITSIKLVPGWFSQAELNAAIWAQMGHTGDTSLFEGEYGFWRFSGSNKWEPEAITERLGENWGFLSTRYKCYPCTGAFQTGLDCFISILDEYNLQPAEIDKVDAFLEGFCEEPIFRNREIKTQADAQMSAAYIFSVAAHQITPGIEWYDLETMTDPSILSFMDKVRFVTHPGYAEMRQNDTTSTLSKVEVRARGKVFTQERTHHKGSPATEDTKISTEELVQKFRHNASRILPWQKSEKVINCILELEHIQDISQLLQLAAI